MGNTAYNHLHVEQLEGGTIITLGKEYDSFDGKVLDEVSQELAAAAKKAQPPVLILDMTHTTFFGSAFIEALVRTWHLLEKQDSEKNGNDARLIFCGLQPYCKEILQVTHLNEIWEIHDDRTTAIEAMAQAT